MVCTALIIGCSTVNKSSGSGSSTRGFLGDTAISTIATTTIGGESGAIVNAQMDLHYQQLQAQLDDSNIRRVGEAIAISVNSGVLFVFDSDEITQDAQAILAPIVRSLNSYENTNILLLVHTDDLGSATYNRGMSERRAQSLATYFNNEGILSDRITAEGRGSTEPIAENTTDAGRLLNRRVELLILANEALRLKMSAK